MFLSLLITILTFIILFIIFINVKKLLKKPLVTYYYSDFIPNISIKGNIIYNNNNTYTTLLKINGYPYHQHDNISDIEQNIRLLERSFNFTKFR